MIALLTSSSKMANASSVSHLIPSIFSAVLMTKQPALTACMAMLLKVESANPVQLVVSHAYPWVLPFM